VIYKEKRFVLIYSLGGWEAQAHGVSICSAPSESLSCFTLLWRAEEQALCAKEESMILF
jgi:hypothetical protein